MSVKVYHSLTDLVDYINKTHHFLKTSSGVYGIKLLRKANGKRIPFEEIKGLKIHDISVHNKDTVVIEQAGFGLQFKSNVKHIYKAKLFLSNLAVVNVYDERTAFFTIDNIDFCYIQNNYSVNVKMLKEWINHDPGILRAQWVNKDSDVHKILDEIGGDRKIKISVTPPRNINMKGNL